MVSVDDIVHRIAQELRIYSGNDPRAAIEELVLGCTFDMHIAITTDMEETELDYMERYGHGHTFYFRLADYDHGKTLASQLYYIVLGIHPNMVAHTGIKFSSEDKLYLFIHIRDVKPVSMNVPYREKV
jgi:hypothetical protein